LVGLAVASNLGSVATLTGNPQNMIIGGLSGIAYSRFAIKLDDRFLSSPPVSWTSIQTFGYTPSRLILWLQGCCRCLVLSHRVWCSPSNSAIHSTL